jgi:hypothetical protein
MEDAKHRSKKRDRLLLEVICMIFILLFLFSAIDKLRNIDNFQMRLAQFDLTSEKAKFISFFLPGVELIISIFLLFRQVRIHGLWASLTLMICFIGYIGYLLVFSANLPCSCAGLMEDMSWQQHLYFNIAFAIIAIYGIILEKKYQKVWFQEK